MGIYGCLPNANRHPSEGGQLYTWGRGSDGQLGQERIWACRRDFCVVFLLFLGFLDVFLVAKIAYCTLW